jgi:transposase
MPKKAPVKTSSAPAAPALNPYAAGIDIGATSIYVAVPAEQDPEPVRRFGTFTQDLLLLADWLKGSGIGTVAMEATGVYWIPLFQILEEQGIEVCLVNARHVKNGPWAQERCGGLSVAATPSFGGAPPRVLPSPAGSAGGACCSASPG